MSEHYLPGDPVWVVVSGFDIPRPARVTHDSTDAAGVPTYWVAFEDRETVISVYERQIKRRVVQGRDADMVKWYKYQCSECGQVMYFTSDAIMRQVKTHHDRRDPMQGCCGKMSRTSDGPVIAESVPKEKPIKFREFL
jgi:hypothetical protein